MSQPTYVPSSLAELARLSDDMWFLAGDTSVDTSWYTKRASLSAIYAATEMFQSQDSSAQRLHTQRFLDDRLADLRGATGAVDAVAEWSAFTARSFVNVLRSKGVRI